MLARKVVSSSEAVPLFGESETAVPRLARESVGRPLICPGEGPSAPRQDHVPLSMTATRSRGLAQAISRCPA